MEKFKSYLQPKQNPSPAIQAAAVSFYSKMVESAKKIAIEENRELVITRNGSTLKATLKNT